MTGTLRGADVLLPAALIVALTALPAPAMAGGARGRGETIETAAGPLTIVNAHENEGRGVEVFLDRRPVLRDRAIEMALVEKSFPEDGPPRVLVLAIGSGGNACPLLLRVIDVGRRPVFVSRQFGTCYDEVDVSETGGGEVRIVQPNRGGEPRAKWVYRNGTLRGP